MGLNDGTRGHLAGYSNLVVDTVGFQDGTAASPAMFFTDETNCGFYRVAGSQIGVSLGGVTAYTFRNIDIIGLSGTEGVPGYGFNAQGTTGMWFVASNRLGFSAGGRQGLEVDKTTTAGETSLLLYDQDSTAMVRVSVGADDSGDLGFKVLQVPN